MRFIRATNADAVMLPDASAALAGARESTVPSGKVIPPVCTGMITLNAPTTRPISAVDLMPSSHLVETRRAASQLVSSSCRSCCGRISAASDAGQKKWPRQVLVGASGESHPR
jgi:hypothetical protein